MKDRAQLLASETIYRQIYDTSNDAIMLLDKDGFFDCNPATLKIFGYQTKEAFINKHPAEHSPLKQPDGSKSDESAAAHIKRAYETGKDFFEWVHKRADGTDFFANVLLTSINVGDQSFLQATVRDIADLKEKENSLKRINKSMVDRELKMVQLKDRIKQLEKKTR